MGKRERGVSGGRTGSGTNRSQSSVDQYRRRLGQHETFEVGRRKKERAQHSRDIAETKTNKSWRDFLLYVVLLLALMGLVYAFVAFELSSVLSSVLGRITQASQ